MADNLLVTGKRGTDHITSAQMGAINASMTGSGNYVSEGLEARMQDANNVIVDKGVLIMNGRASVIESPTKLTIQSGMTGKNRNDLIVARYSKSASSLVEDVHLEVITGTPVSGTPSDPRYTKADILTGALNADFPLYRVQVRGIETPTLVPMFDVLPTLKSLGDSISRIEAFMNRFELNDIEKIKIFRHPNGNIELHTIRDGYDSGLYWSVLGGGTYSPTEGKGVTFATKG